MQICNTKRRAYLHCAGITFADRMAAFCSFCAIRGGKCGSNRGCADFVCLNSCNADFSSHLMSHHLSRENVCEMDLILARAGLLELTDDQIKNMTDCPVHRYTLGKYWQAPKTCQYPKHHGKIENANSRSTRYYFGGARSKGFAKLSSVSKSTFLGQDWARKVCRFSVLFGYLTK